GGADGGECFRIGGCNGLGAELFEALGQFRRTGEGGLHRDLLVQELTDQEGQRVCAEQADRSIVTDEPKRRHSHRLPHRTCARLPPAVSALLSRRTHFQQCKLTAKVHSTNTHPNLAEVSSA